MFVSRHGRRRVVTRGFLPRRARLWRRYFQQPQNALRGIAAGTIDDRQFLRREFRQDVLSRTTRLLWPPHPDLHATKRIAAERSMY